MLIMSRDTRPWIENVKPVALGARPNESFGIDQQRAHGIAGQRLRLLWIVPELLESFGAALPARHTAAIRRQPKIALRVLGDRPDIVAGQPMWIAAIAAELAHAIAVISVQSGFGRKPDVALRV